MKEKIEGVLTVLVAIALIVGGYFLTPILWSKFTLAQNSYLSSFWMSCLVGYWLFSLLMSALTFNHYAK